MAKLEVCPPRVSADQAAADDADGVGAIMVMQSW
jgi:hypothetical protein